MGENPASGKSQDVTTSNKLAVKVRSQPPTTLKKCRTARQPLALSFWMPWAWLCCTPRPGDPSTPIKDVENRTWPTEFRGRIYVHATKKFEMEAFGIDLRTKLREYPGVWEHMINLSRTWKEGAIIGEVTIDDCVVCADSPWAVHDGRQWNWLLSHPKRYATPIPYKGQRKFFEVVGSLPMRVTR